MMRVRTEQWMNKPLNELQQVLVMELHKLTKGLGFLARNVKGAARKRQLESLRVRMREANVPAYILYGKYES